MDKKEPFFNVLSQKYKIKRGLMKSREQMAPCRRFTNTLKTLDESFSVLKSVLGKS